MELLIVPILINLFISAIKALFRLACIVLTGIAGAIGTARNRSERRAELENRARIEQAKMERIEADRAARIERERIKADRAAIEWEWKVQKEADRRAELEYKRRRRDMIDRERLESSRNKEQSRRRIAQQIYGYNESLNTDIEPMAAEYREAFENATSLAEKERLYKKLYKLEAMQHRAYTKQIKARYDMGGA